MPRSLDEVVLAERQRRRRAQRRPVVAADREEPASGLDHVSDPTLAPCHRCNPPPTARKQRGDYPTPPWLVERVVANTLPARGVAGRRVTRARPGVRGRPVPRRRGPPAARGAGADVELVGMDIDADAVARHGGRSPASPAAAPTWRVEHGDALAHDWARRPLRRRRRQPAVPLAARRGDDARRGQPPRRRAVRRRRRRVPRPRRAARAARRRAHRARAAAVDPGVARRRRRAGRARPAGDDHLVVVVAAARVRRPGARVRARLRGPSRRARRRLPATGSWSHVVTDGPRVPDRAGAGDGGDARRRGPG